MVDLVNALGGGVGLTGPLPAAPKGVRQLADTPPPLTQDPTIAAKLFETFFPFQEAFSQGSKTADEQAKFAAEQAVGLIGGGLGKGIGTAIFLGPMGIAKRLKQTADIPFKRTEHNLSEIAKKLQDSPGGGLTAEPGSLSDELFKKARLLIGPDGIMRQEIPDIAASLNYIPKLSKNRPIQFELAHPNGLNLHELYDIPFMRFEPTEVPGSAALYNPATDQISLDGGVAASQIHANIPLLKRLAVHELQHPIQKREGMVQGTNPAASPYLAEFWQNIGKDPATLTEKDWQAALTSVRAADENDPLYKAALRVYLQNAAEVEARNAERRLVNPKLLNLHPRRTEDIPLGLQLDNQGAPVGTAAQIGGKDDIDKLMADIEAMFDNVPTTKPLPPPVDESILGLRPTAKTSRPEFLTSLDVEAPFRTGPVFGSPPGFIKTPWPDGFGEKFQNLVTTLEKTPWKPGDPIPESAKKAFEEIPKPLPSAPSIIKPQTDETIEWLRAFSASPKTFAEREADRLAGGFTEKVFHGTRFEFKPTFGEDAFATELQGPAFFTPETFVTPESRLANMYARFYPHLFTDPDALKNEVDLFQFSNSGRGPGVLPLWLNPQGFHLTDAAGASWEDFNNLAIAAAREIGAPGVHIKNVWDEPASTQYLGSPQDIFIVFDPSRLRSTAAKFDPKKFHLNDLLAGLAGAGVVTGATLGQPDAP